MDEENYSNCVRSASAEEESALKKFSGRAADDNTAFLGYDLIAGCEYRAGDRWQTDLLDCKNPLFVGVDVGREHDLTVIWLVEQVGGVNFTRRVIELSKQTFDAQEQALYELLKLPMVRRCCIDQSGLGRQFAERKSLAPIRLRASISQHRLKRSWPTRCVWLLKNGRSRCRSLTP